MPRHRSIPPAALTIRETPRVCATAFTKLGASDATRAQSGSQPIDDHVALQHFEQQAGSAPGGVFLLAGDPVAGAHDAAFEAAALAHPDAAPGGLAEAVIVIGEGEVGRRFPRLIVGALAEIGVQRVRVDHLAGVHPVAWVEQRLELLECRDDPLAEHSGEQLAAGLAVAVLARQRSSVRHHQLGRAFDKAAVSGDPVGAAQVEGDASVHTALPEVPIQRSRAVAELVEQALEVP